MQRLYSKEQAQPREGSVSASRGTRWARLAPKLRSTERPKAPPVSWWRVEVWTEDPTSRRLQVPPCGSTPERPPIGRKSSDLCLPMTKF